MKRLLITLVVMLFSFTAFAEVLQFKTTAYAYADVHNGSYKWSDWQDSNMLLILDLDNDMMTVYSPKIQYYKITQYNGKEYDGKGGLQASFRGVDQDGDICGIRLRVEKSGSSQVYVDFNNCAWVYNVKRTN